MSDQVKEQEQTDIENADTQETRLSTADMAGRRQPAGRATGTEEKATPLLPADKVDDFRSRWSSVQTGFVDEPRKAVEKADSLVAEVMQDLAKTFADERQNLESQWGRGDDVSTEDLRLALQKYRSFFSRLLSI